MFSRTRGEINVLMCGDPGTSKSQLLAFVHKVSQWVSLWFSRPAQPASFFVPRGIYWLGGRNLDQERA